AEFPRIHLRVDRLVVRVAVRQADVETPDDRHEELDERLVDLVRTLRERDVREERVVVARENQRRYAAPARGGIVEAGWPKIGVVVRVQAGILDDLLERLLS